MKFQIDIHFVKNTITPRPRLSECEIYLLYTNAYLNDRISYILTILFCKINIIIEMHINALTLRIAIFCRAFWMVTVMCAVLFATYAIIESWKTYNESSIDTVVETTFLSYSKIAFPMVVICDSSRVDWERVKRLTAE